MLSKGANFLPFICAIIVFPQISFYGNYSEEITERLFFVEATHKKSQKTLINMTS